MGIERVRLTTTTTGVTGSATGQATTSSNVSGRVAAVYVYVGSGGTADITLGMQGAQATENILSLGTITASAWYYPRKAICDYAGAAVYVTTGKVYEQFIVHDNLTLNVSNATTAVSFRATIFIDT